MEWVKGALLFFGNDRVLAMRLFDTPTTLLLLTILSYSFLKLVRAPAVIATRLAA